MTGAEIFERSAASVANVVALQGGQRQGSGTCFVTNGRLVTCAHVWRAPPGFEIRLSFDKPAAGFTNEWSYGANRPDIRGLSEEHSFDFAIFDPPHGQPLPPGLEFADGHPPAPGEPVAVLGYPFEDPHLTLHQGYVSAVFNSGPATMLKLDMSINPSNSGGPVIRLSDGKVVGVVARKATGLSHAFDQLLGALDQNIRQLSAPRDAYVRVGGVDPIEALLLQQRQMFGAAIEIQRSANVGIGYAIWIEPLRAEQAFCG